MSTKRIPSILRRAGAIKYSPDKPFKLKSGKESPVYIDNRVLAYSPDVWRVIIDALGSILPPCDLIAGVPTGGVIHAAALAYQLKKPMVVASWGQFRHSDVVGKRVVVVEDNVTTGGSALKGVFSLLDSGADIKDVVAITAYDSAFEELAIRNITLHALTTLSEILEKSRRSAILDEIVAESQEMGLYD